VKITIDADMKINKWIVSDKSFVIVTVLKKIEIRFKNVKRLLDILVYNILI